MNLDLKIIINGAIANILAVLVLGILSLVFLDKKRILAPWIYNYFGKFGQVFVKYVNLLIKLLIHPIFRVLLFLILLILINYKSGDTFLSIIVFLILLSFLWKPRPLTLLPASKFSDGFENIDNWEKKTGNPEIEIDFGKPAPCLGLKKISNQAINSFVILKNIETEYGIIECDFYLEQDAIFNIVFFADSENDNWYMARYDSRDNYSDGFLIKENGAGANWRNFRMSGTQTNIKKWHRARIEFNSTRVAMYKDGVLLVEFRNPKIFGKKIGLFNEVNHVHVDNFFFIEKV